MFNFKSLNSKLIAGDLNRCHHILGCSNNRVVEAVVFTRDTEFTPVHWGSLRPYRIGLIRGIKFAENNTQGMNRHRVNTYHSLFMMLETGRLQLAVAPRINGLAHIRHSGILDIRE